MMKAYKPDTRGLLRGQRQPTQEIIWYVFVKCTLYMAFYDVSW